MSSAWRYELVRVIAAITGGALLGWLLGRPGWGLAAGGLAYLGWAGVQLFRIEAWLNKGAKLSRAPESSGVWDRVIQHVYDLKQRARQRKRRLHDLLGRFHRFTEAIPDATVLLKRNGEIEWANDAARVLLGIRNPQDRGRRIEHLLRLPEFQRYFSARDYAQPLDIRSPALDEVELNLRIVTYGRDECLLTARDVSSLRRLREARRDFVANVSHELRTPLTVIAGYVETIASDPELPESLSGHLGAVKDQSRRMQQLVEDLLVLSRLEMDPLVEQEPELVPVAQLVESICADARRLGHRHELVTDLDAALHVLGRESELRSAFANLVVNAVQHTPPGTRVEISWKGNAAGARFRVADNGPGIERAHLARLTERFYRVDRSRSRASGGTGLGLAIVKHALERHHAHLEIDSGPGKGAVFACQFPVQRVERRAAPRAAVTVP